MWTGNPSDKMSKQPSSNQWIVLISDPFTVKDRSIEAKILQLITYAFLHDCASVYSLAFWAQNYPLVQHRWRQNLIQPFGVPRQA